MSSARPARRPMAAHTQRRNRRSLLAAGAAIATVLLSFQAAFAVHDEGFELDANVAADGQVDWASLYDVSSGVATVKASLPSTPNVVTASFTSDYALPDTSTYATGSKDTLPINVPGSGDWQCSRANNVGDKFDLVNSYAAAIVPSSGPAANHLIVYFGSEISSPNGNRNAGLWLLKDDTVGCSTTAGGSQNFTGHHSDGDVFIVSAFTNGGTTSNIDVYRWTDSSPEDGNGDVGGLLVKQGSFAGVTCPTTDLLDRACAISNADPTGSGDFSFTPPWEAPDKNGGALDEGEFFEGAVDLTGLGLNGCFANVMANTRSSQEPGSTLMDFALGSFNTCAMLKVQKFVDFDGDGTRDAGDVAGRWAFDVTGPSPSTTSVCSGTTDAAGELSCEGLRPGTYTVTETQIGGYYNTKAGSTVAVDTTASPSATVTLGLGGVQTVSFGNICYVTKNISVTGVPTSGAAQPTSITAQYKVNDAAAFTDLALTDGGSGTWTGSVTGLKQTDTISWQYYINGATTHTRTGATDESMQAGDPTNPNGTSPAGGSRTAGCSVVNSTTYPSMTVNGFKFKDMNANGVKDVDDPNTAADEADPGIGGFDFTLSATGVSKSATSSSTAATLGTYSFSGVYPGTYTVAETDKAHWFQTLPLGNGANRTVTVHLDDTSATVADFGNTPLSDIGVTFSDNGTGKSTSTISCTGPDQPTGAPGTIDAEQTDGSLSGTDLVVGTYTCTIVIVDP